MSQTFTSSDLVRAVIYFIPSMLNSVFVCSPSWTHESVTDGSISFFFIIHGTKRNKETDLDSYKVTICRFIQVGRYLAFLSGHELQESRPHGKTLNVRSFRLEGLMVMWFILLLLFNQNALFKTKMYKIYQFYSAWSRLDRCAPQAVHDQYYALHTNDDGKSTLNAVQLYSLWYAAHVRFWPLHHISFSYFFPLFCLLF